MKASVAQHFGNQFIESAINFTKCFSRFMIIQIHFGNQFIESAIKFRKCISRFMIPIALLEKLAVNHLFRDLIEANEPRRGKTNNVTQTDLYKHRKELEA